MLAAILFVVGLLAIMVLCGRCTAKFAAEKGRSRGVWFVLGALFFPLSSIALALLPSHVQTQP